MLEPIPPTREKLPSRLLAPVHRLQWKDVVIGALALLFVSMSYAFQAPLAEAQTATTPQEPLQSAVELSEETETLLAEALNGPWYTECTEVTCVLSKRILRSDPDHPADLDHPEYISVVVSIARQSGKIDALSFHVPPDADPRQGLFVEFSKTTVDPTQEGCSTPAEKKPIQCFHRELDPEGPLRLPLGSCSKEECMASVVGGRVEKGSDRLHSVDLMEKLLKQSHILILYVRQGEPLRATNALLPFQEAYRKLREGPLRPH